MKTTGQMLPSKQKSGNEIYFSTKYTFLSKKEKKVFKTNNEALNLVVINY